MKDLAKVAYESYYHGLDCRWEKEGEARQRYFRTMAEAVEQEVRKDYGDLMESIDQLERVHFDDRPYSELDGAILNVLRERMGK